jgi:hypothetical protein
LSVAVDGGDGSGATASGGDTGNGISVDVATEDGASSNGGGGLTSTGVGLP